MSVDPLPTFERTAGEVATVHRTTAASFPETLAAAVTEPAVGTPPGLDGVSLADTPVDTDPSPTDVEAAETGVTPAGVGVADYGTVTVPSVGLAELASLYCPRHVAVLAASDIVPDMPAAYERLGEAFDDGADTQILATGPSSTADMGELIQGVHGPVETHVVVVTDR
jgi:L-lactate dehydrogenase complex protein LldG